MTSWDNNKYLRWLDNPLTGDPSVVKKLTLMGSRIKIIPESIREFRNLEKFRLYDTRDVSRIPDSILELQSLTEIELVNNAALEYIPDLSRLTKLYEFSIKGGQTDDNSGAVAALDINTFAHVIFNIRTLRRFGIDSTNLSALPDLVHSLPYLTSLSIIDCKLEHVSPSLFLNTPSLKSLFVASNRLVDIPDTIGNASSLEYLSLSHNRLETLPDSIAECTRLNRLVLLDNNFTEFPIAVTRCPNLNAIYMGNNKLSAVPAEISGLNLATIDINDNRFTEIPENICNLETLVTLNISDNNIHVIRPELRNLTNLRTLHIGSNPLEVFPQELFETMPNLREVVSDIGNYYRRNNGHDGFYSNSNDDEYYGNGDGDGQACAPMGEGLAYEVHNAFAKLNKRAFYDLVEGAIGVPVIPEAAQMPAYIKNKLGEFIGDIDDAAQKTTARADLDRIMVERLDKVKYGENMMKVIVYSLEYVAKQGRLFRGAYAQNFTHDTAHAYAGAAGMSCFQGVIERFILSLTGAAVSVRTAAGEAIEYKPEYDALIGIINKIDTGDHVVADVLKEKGGSCYKEAEGDEALFRACIKREVAAVLANSYPGNTVVNGELNAPIAGMKEQGMFGGRRGGKRRRGKPSGGITLRRKRGGDLKGLQRRATRVAKKAAKRLSKTIRKAVRKMKKGRRMTYRK